MLSKKDKTRISICALVSNNWSHTVFDAEGAILEIHEGSVPSFMPGQHLGVYIMLEIDPYTGLILNWNRWKQNENESETKEDGCIKK